MLKGEQVAIRAVKESDLDSLYTLSQAFSDPGEFMPVVISSQSRFKKEFAETGFWHNQTGKLIIEDKSSNIVGEAGLFSTSHYLDGRELYYRIFSGYRGKGYATEALSLLTTLFFTSSNFNRLQAVTIQGNMASEHILKKANFIFEGTLRQARYFKGELVNLNMYSLLREDFQV